MHVALETGPAGGPLLQVGRRAVPLVPALVTLAALAATLNVLGNGFTLDAEVDILANRFVRGPLAGLPAMLTSDYTAGSNLPSGFWRPVVLLCYWVLWRLGLGTPVAFYAANIALHAAVALGVFRLAQRLGAGVAAAAAGALLFAVHPVHTDVTAGVVGLKDLLAAAGFVGAFVALLAARAAGEAGAARTLTVRGLALFLVGVLSKESALALLPCLLAVDLGDALMRPRTADGTAARAPRRLIALQYAGLVAVVALKFGLQRVFLGGTIERVAIDPTDNPLVLLGPLERRLQALAFIPFYLGRLVWPARLSPDYSYDALPLSPAAMPPAAWLGVALIALGVVAAAWALARAERPLFHGVALAAACYLPVSNLVVTLGTNAAERFLYLPSIGACLVAGWAFARLLAPVRRAARGGAPWAPRLAWGALALVVLAGIVRSDLRNRDWRDKFTLWSSAHEVVPRNLKVVLNLSQHLVAREQSGRALALLDGALAQQDPIPATQPLLAVYRPLLKSQKAAALAELGRGDEARALFAAVIAEAPDQPDPRIRLARLLNRQGDPAGALAQLHAALAVDLTTAELTRVEEESLLALVALEPGEDAAALRAVARTIVTGPLPAARERLLALQGSRPEAALPAYMLGVVLRRMGQPDAACDAWRQARGRARPGSPLAAEIDRQLELVGR